MVGLRLGEMVLTTFPGELSVRIGLKLKASSPHPVRSLNGPRLRILVSDFHENSRLDAGKPRSVVVVGAQETFIASYSNGYIFYSPTEEQLANVGAAQEDCDVMLGPGWQEIYEAAMDRMLGQL